MKDFPDPTPFVRLCRNISPLENGYLKILKCTCGNISSRRESRRMARSNRGITWYWCTVCGIAEMRRRRP